MRNDPPWSLHVRCLRPGCGREAVVEPKVLYGPRELWPRPGSGLDRSGRLVCRCGGRGAHVSWMRGRPKPDNPCGWL